MVQITSGASEMMRMKRFSRSSRPTGPKIRVPRGSPSGLKITAAFSSNLMYEPSARRRSFAVRTTTALTISPFLTFPPGMASLTVATMMSPMPAYRRPDPPSTRMHKISLAPVLSATLSRDSCWIISALPSQTHTGALPPWTPAGAPPQTPEAHHVLLGFLQNFDETPALGGAQRSGLHHAYPVAKGGTVLFVVRLEPAGLTYHLAVEAVLDAVFDRDNDRLVHLVADHVALADFASPALCAGRISRPALCAGRISRPALCAGRISRSALCDGGLRLLIGRFLCHSSTS